MSTRRAPNNRSVTLSSAEEQKFAGQLLQLSGPAELGAVENRTIHQDLFEILDWLPESAVDLLFIDPPYNMTKSFNSTRFTEMSVAKYAEWLESWLPRLLRVLKPTGSVYICGDWRSSAAIHLVTEQHLIVRNRITWEREKGRGAKSNWKNCSEDIWFCTASDDFFFDVDAVMLKRRVIAPYTSEDGRPKDWTRTDNGNFRLTHPSNLWSDLTVPFWSMPENTEHPTQKPEKLLGKIILASSRPGDVVLDPFLGSGTTSVVAKKLGRRYIGVEVDQRYCCLAEKRVALADECATIQGYADGVFWERNSLREQNEKRDQARTSDSAISLFGE